MEYFSTTNFDHKHKICNGPYQSFRQEPSSEKEHRHEEAGLVDLSLEISNSLLLVGWCCGYREKINASSNFSWQHFKRDGFSLCYAVVLHNRIMGGGRNSSFIVTIMGIDIGNDPEDFHFPWASLSQSCEQLLGQESSAGVSIPFLL